MPDYTHSRDAGHSQNERILAALRAGERLTPLTALEQFQCMRLGARIGELRTSGHDIRRTFIRTPTRKTVCEYYLVPPEA